MHVYSELRSQQTHPQLYFDLKMQANKLFGHLFISFFKWPKISDGCDSPFLFCLISSTFLHSGYFFFWACLGSSSFHGFSIFSCCPHLAFCIYNARAFPASVYLINAFPCILTAFFSTADNIHPSLSDQQTCCCWEGPQMCLFYCFLLSHSPMTLATNSTSGRWESSGLSFEQLWIISVQAGTLCSKLWRKIKMRVGGTILLQLMKSKFCLNVMFVSLVSFFICFGLDCCLFFKPASHRNWRRHKLGGRKKKW